MSDLKEIQPTDVTISLGGKDRRLKFGFKSWAKLEDKFGSINAIFKAIMEKPFNNLPALLAIGIVKEDGEDITEETVIGWLDEYEISELKDFLLSVKKAISSSLPEDKKKDGDPSDAEAPKE